MTHEPGDPTEGFGNGADARDRRASLWRRWHELSPPETSGAILPIGGAVILLAELIRAFVRRAMQRQRCRERGGSVQPRFGRAPVIDGEVLPPEPEEKRGS